MEIEHIAYRQVRSVFGIASTRILILEAYCRLNLVIVVIGLRVYETHQTAYRQIRSVFGIPSTPNIGQYLGLMESQKLE